MNKVLLTGASGFVGRQVAKALIADGCNVTATVRGDKSVPEGLAATIAVEDLFTRDRTFWAETCAGFDTVVHVAWYAEPGLYLSSEKNLTCLSGTLALAQGAVDAGVRKFVGVGTCFEYDLAAPDLAASQPLRPESPLGPTTLYGAAKSSVWLTLSELLKLTPVEFAWCRLFYLFGEGEDPRRLVPYLKARLSESQPCELTAGTQVRDFLDVAEAGRRIARAALGPHNGALNICSGQPITVRDFALNIANDFGRPDLLRFGVRPDNESDPPFVVGIPSL